MTDGELLLLASRLKSTMAGDVHQEEGCYEIRSLYFDDVWDRCMDENEAGVDQREKYRIRIYNADSGVIHLERKEKRRGLTHKESCDLSFQECCGIMDGSLPLTLDSRKPLNQLQMQARCCGMSPKAILRYERTAFVCDSGNVRITFDRNIGSSRYCSDLFEPQIRGIVPVLPSGMHILEVKYDEFLPDHIAGLLETGKLQQTAFSKYYFGRMALAGEFVPGMTGGR